MNKGSEIKTDDVKQSVEVSPEPKKQESKKQSAPTETKKIVSNDVPINQPEPVIAADKQATPKQTVKEQPPTSQEVVERIFSTYHDNSALRIAKACAVEYLNLNPEKKEASDIDDQMSTFYMLSYTQPFDMKGRYGVDCTKYSHLGRD